MIEDLSRVIQINTAWKLNEQKKRSTSMKHFEQIPCSAQNNKNYQLSRLPYLIRNYNSVEKNIFAVSTVNKSYTRQYESPTKSQESPSKLLLDNNGLNPIIPSKKFTKSQNKVILDNLLKSFNTLKGLDSKQQDSYIKSRMKMKRLLYQSQDQDTSFITNQQIQENSLQEDNQQSVQQLNLESVQRIQVSQDTLTSPQTRQQNYIIDRQTCVKDGVKYPYRLFIMHNSRKQMIEQLMDKDKRKDNVNKYGNKQNQTFETIKNKNVLHLQNQVRNQQLNKKKRELISRNSMTNAYYALMALDKVSQGRVKQTYKVHQPQDSRFYLL